MNLFLDAFWRAVAYCLRPRVMLLSLLPLALMVALALLTVALLMTPVLSPLIWGWLTYRVMAFDALTEHASVEERPELFRRHRGWLLGIGIFCGYMGAAPSVLWASGALFAAAYVGDSPERITATLTRAFCLR